MKKDSFILYNSFYEPIKSLKNEQLGKLLRAVFNYTINNEITQDNEVLVAFMFIKNQIDMDSKKWEDQKEKRSEAGKKGMASRWGNNDNNTITKDNNVINDITKITDNVNVNDNVYVDVYDNIYKKENIKRKNFVKPTIDEINKYCLERNNGINANAFYDFYESKNWYVGKNKMKDWKACVRTWETRNKKTQDVPMWFNDNNIKENISLEEEKELKEMLKEFGE